MTTSRSTWKAFERRVASFFGSRRAPLSGSNGGQTASDSLHPDLYIEAKLRAKSAVCTLFEQVERSARVEDKLPVVALQHKNRAGWLLVCRPGDLVEIAKNITTDCPCGRCENGLRKQTIPRLEHTLPTTSTDSRTNPQSTENRIERNRNESQ